MPLTHREFFPVAKALIAKWAELIGQEIDRDVAGDLDLWQLIYLRALWQKRIDLLFEISKRIVKEEDLRKQLDVVTEVFGDQLEAPREELQRTVQSRLDWMKRRVAKEFEKRVTSEINLHGISSPIEQIFLMEWIFGKYSERLGVRLVPQKAIETDKGRFVVDFLIVQIASEKEVGRIAIELDGHEFHEKTPEQAARDKKRERALTRSGITVFRFTGSEVFRNPRACIEEVADYLSAR